MKELIYPKVKEGLYKIDEYGNIWSNYKSDYMKTQKDKDGYLKIKLSGGSRKNPVYVRIATLVAWNFIGSPNNLKDPTINHIDGNILNNHYSNLEWIERGKNSSIRRNTGKGSNNHESKLTEEQVLDIRKKYNPTKITYKEIAKEYNVSKSCIANIIQGNTWRHI